MSTKLSPEAQANLEAARRADGKFGHQVKSEAEGSLDSADRPLTDQLGLGDSAVFDSSQFGTGHSYTELHVTHHGDGVQVEAHDSDNVHYALAAVIAGHDDPSATDYEAAEWFLTEYSEDAVAWFENETGSTLDRACDWDGQRFCWETREFPEATLNDVLATADEEVDSCLHPAQDPAFYSRMFMEAPGYLRRQKVAAATGVKPGPHPVPEMTPFDPMTHDFALLRDPAVDPTDEAANQRFADRQRAAAKTMIESRTETEQQRLDNLVKMSQRTGSAVGLHVTFPGRGSALVSATVDSIGDDRLSITTSHGNHDVIFTNQLVDGGDVGDMTTRFGRYLSHVPEPR